MTLSLIPENQTESDVAEIEQMLDLAFGLSRLIKTSYRLREGNTAAEGLSLVMRETSFGLVGAISFWPLGVGQSEAPALLLGPLVVHPNRQNLGIGRALMHEGIARAKARGHELILLIGDEPYYARVGFARVPEGQIQVPGPTDLKRLLFLELQPGALKKAKGLALAPWRWRQIIALRATT
jgi:predicted N-acetyltransferase YhbS